MFRIILNGYYVVDGSTISKDKSKAALFENIVIANRFGRVMIDRMFEEGWNPIRTYVIEKV